MSEIEKNTTKLLNNRDEVIQYIGKRRTEGAKVIDFGGGGSAWTYDFVDAIADIEPERLQQEKEVYKADFNYPSSFKNIKRYDISITSHTLEDIRAPNFLLDAMASLSDEGFIIVPSSYIELSYLESFYYLGCCHHRWIFIFDGESLVIYPKLPSLNLFFATTTFYKRVFETRYKVLQKIHYPLVYIFNFLFKKRFKNVNSTNKREEMIIHWKKNIHYKFINSDFAPSGEAIADWYKNILINDKNMG